MALEIKGLKAKALKMRQNIDALNRAYDTFNEKAPSHVKDVTALADQVDELNSDLGFAATMLGNSTEQSNDGEEKKGDDKPKEETITIDAGANPKRMNF